METGTRSLRKVFRNGSCNDCPLAIIYLLVITPKFLCIERFRLSPLPCGRRPAHELDPQARCSAAVYHSDVAIEDGLRLILTLNRAHRINTATQHRAAFGHLRANQGHRPISIRHRIATTPADGVPDDALQGSRWPLPSPAAPRRPGIPIAVDNPPSGLPANAN